MFYGTLIQLGIFYQKWTCYTPVLAKLKPCLLSHIFVNDRFIKTRTVAVKKIELAFFILWYCSHWSGLLSFPKTHVYSKVYKGCCPPLNIHLHPGIERSNPSCPLLNIHLHEGEWKVLYQHSPLNTHLHVSIPKPLFQPWRVLSQPHSTKHQFTWRHMKECPSCPPLIHICMKVC